MISSSSSINLLEWLTEEAFYLLSHWFIIKGCSSGIADGRETEGMVWGRGAWSEHALSRPPLFHFSALAPKQKLSIPCPLGFFWRLHYLDSLAVVTDSTSSPSQLSEGPGWGDTESLTFLPSKDV